MKMLLILVPILSTCCLFAQNKSDSVTPETHLRIDRVKERQRKINMFADSINNYNGGDVPGFLCDECLDIQTNSFFGFHSGLSLRWEILQRVNNKKGLKMLIKADDKKLNKKCALMNAENYGDGIPLIDKSFRDLIRKRYKQLKR